MEADAAGNATTHNIYSINLAGRVAGEEGYYYFYNAHGDVVRLSGTKDSTEVKYRYDAFGTLISVEGDVDNSITYAGYQYNAESGLYYLNARYYDSTTARFLTEDTYGGSADDPLSQNRYTYCANNPLRYTDPSGHFWGAAVKFVVGAVVGAVTEYVTQKYIEKRDTINVKAVVYEGVVGGVTAVIGSTGSISKNQQKMQSQTTGRSYLATKKTTIGVTSLVEDNTKKVEYISKEDILNYTDGVTEKSMEIAEKI